MGLGRGRRHLRAELHGHHGHRCRTRSCAPRTRRSRKPRAWRSGEWGAIIIAICAVLKSVGSLGGWMLLVGQSGKAAADDGMFPRVFARLNRNGVPGAGLHHRRGADDGRAVRHHVADAGRAVQSHRQSRGHPHHRAVHLFGGGGREGGPRPRRCRASTFRQLQVHRARSRWPIACGSCIGGDPKTVVHAMVALLISVPLYPFFIRSMARREAQGSAGSVRPMRRHDMINRRSSVMTPQFCHEARSPLRCCWRSPRRRLSRQTKRRSPRRRPVCPRAWTGRSTWTRPSARSASAIRCISTRGPMSRRAISVTTGPRERSRRASAACIPATSGRQWYGKISGVGERTFGAAPSLVGGDASSFGVEDLYIGWRSGGEKSLWDFSVGREQYKLGHGMLLYDGASEGGSRGGYWTNARKAFELAAIGRFKPGNSTRSRRSTWTGTNCPSPTAAASSGA